MNEDSHIFYPDFDLGAFRFAVARYVKLLIRARWKHQPGFLSQAELAQWHLDDIESDPLPSWRLLELAAAALGLLNSEFLPRCGSGGVRETDESTPEGRLIGDVAFLAETEGGGPFHNFALLSASITLRKGLAVDWDKLVVWSRLPTIRSDLDKLPFPQQPTRPSPQTCDIEALAQKNMFRKTGKTWTISYKGQTIAKTHSVGLLYIGILLSKPRVALSASKLRQIYAAWKADSSRPLRTQAEWTTIAGSGNLDENVDLGDDLHLPGADLGEELDPIARQCYERRIEELLCDIAQLRSEGKHAQADELEEDLRFIKGVLKTGRSPGGRPRKMSSASKKDRDAVCTSIRRALADLQKDHSLLRQHFQRSLQLGSVCCYAPETPTIWNQ
jgi:hypothetical protein